MTATQPASLGATVRYPLVWPGYLLGILFFILVTGETMIDPYVGNRQTLLPYLTWVGAIIYWLFCIHRFHRIMAASTGGLYPISPRRAVGFHFIPFYNLYWLFRWTNAVAAFVNARVAPGTMWRGWPGAILLGAFVLARFDAGIALILIFAVTHYIRSKLSQATRAQGPA